MNYLWINCLFLLAGTALGDALTEQQPVDKVDIQVWGDLYLPEFLVKNQDSAEKGLPYFSGLEPLLTSARFNIANLEGVVTRSAYPLSLEKSFLLRMSTSVPDLLNQVNIKAVTLGNNHSMDFGGFGLREMLGRLESKKILYAGAGTNLEEALQPAILTTNRGPVCVFSFARTLPKSTWADIDKEGVSYASFGQIKEVVLKAEPWCYSTIAVFHWGQEATSKVKEYQEKLARLVIDAGADAVVGHHPHVLQRVEQYKGVSIIYSVGNFVFGSAPFGAAPEGAVARFNFGRYGKLVLKSVIPIQVNNAIVNYRPRLMTKEESSKIKKDLFPSCRLFSNPERFECSEKFSTLKTKSGRSFD